MNPQVEQYKSMIGQHLNHHSPIAELLNPKLLAVEEGMLEAELLIKPSMANAMGILHGGIVALIMDEILGAVTFTFGEETFYATSNLNIHFLAMTNIGDKVVATANVVKKGRRIVFVEAKLLSHDRKKVIASATADLVPTSVAVPKL